MELEKQKQTSSAKNGKPTFHAKPSDRWSDVTIDFFLLSADGGLPYAEKHLKTDEKTGKPDYRKLKDQFDVLYKDVVQDIETGNQSGKAGDLS